MARVLWPDAPIKLRLEHQLAQRSDPDVHPQCVSMRGGVGPLGARAPLAIRNCERLSFQSEESVKWTVRATKHQPVSHSRGVVDEKVVLAHLETHVHQVSRVSEHRPEGPADPAAMHPVSPQWIPVSPEPLLPVTWLLSAPECPA